MVVVYVHECVCVHMTPLALFEESGAEAAWIESDFSEVVSTV